MVLKFPTFDWFKVHKEAETNISNSEADSLDLSEQKECCFKAGFYFIVTERYQYVFDKDIPFCEDGFYYNRGEVECVQCSECEGANLIIRAPCGGDQNTICGPFVEFDKFHQSPIDNVKPNQTYEWFDKTVEDNQHTNFPTTVDQDKKWYTLAMALLGVLSFISLAVGIYIIAVCFVCKRRRREKEIIYDPELCTQAGANQSTRLVQSSAVPSRDRLKTHRNTYTLDEDYDADNSNQTVSSTSSHYVYFKTADPPNV
ncbi:unnamed protein product [Mytilus coruscus]|uniref:TNFR-Cys domain-containing protein n=1 Tax=Mytilus coruscus TaxID=42192 RepID=A0A6J8DIT9_MYTCO|nr:unnamed protein product [Mytilus coruscus]